MISARSLTNRRCQRREYLRRSLKRRVSRLPVRCFAGWLAAFGKHAISERSECAQRERCERGQRVRRREQFTRVRTPTFVLPIIAMFIDEVSLMNWLCTIS